MMPKAETSGDDLEEEWSTPVNWEECPAIKAKRRSTKFGFALPLSRLRCPRYVIEIQTTGF